MTHVLIRRDENIEPLCFGRIQKLTVAQGLPSALIGGFYYVVVERFSEGYRIALIKQNSHATAYWRRASERLWRACSNTASI